MFKPAFYGSVTQTEVLRADSDSRKMEWIAGLVLATLLSMAGIGCAAPSSVVSKASGSNSVATAPSITARPASQSVLVGQTATFAVEASGTAPLHYQWEKNEAFINGATSAIYTTPAIRSSDQGSTYQVVVSNSAGTATSSPATLSVSSAPSGPPAPSDPSGSGATLLGITYGEDGWSMSDVQSMETWQGKKFATVQIFSSWCPGDTWKMDKLLNVQLPNVWNNGNVPILTWQPNICSADNTPSNVDALIAAGDYDSYLNQFAAGVKQFLSGPDGVFGTSDDRRLYIRFAHEMNGDWYRWSASSSRQSPAQFVSMWQHVRSIFDAQGIDASHLQWIWCVSSKDAAGTGYTAEQYYPGDAYVDWIGIDAYNFGDQTFGGTTFKWQFPDRATGPMLTRMRALANKPIGLMETSSSATTSAGVNLSAKDQWIQQLYAYVLTQRLGMVVWFNYPAPLGGTSCCRLGDWPVFGGTLGDSSYDAGSTTYLAFSSFQPAVDVSALVSGDLSNSRLLTDDLFMGR